MRFIRTVVSLTLIFALAFSFVASAGVSHAQEPGAALFDEYCICGDCRTCEECIICVACDACEVCYACEECNSCEDRFLCDDCYTCEDCYLCEDCYKCEDCITCNYCQINKEPCTGDEFCTCEDCYSDYDFSNIGEYEDAFVGGEAIDTASLDLSIALIESNAIEQFVARMYWQALGKEPTQANLIQWTDALKKGEPAATVAYKIIFSNEFLRRNVSNDSFVDILYRSLLNREPDSSGRTMWLNRIVAGWPRENALASFIKSVEFTNICKQTGIVRGIYTPPPGITEHTKIVMDMYRGILGREPKQESLQLWLKRIRDGRTGASVAQGFVFSSEAKRRNISNEQYIDSLYRGLLGREPDSSGRTMWLNRLKAGWPREDALAKFVISVEFTKLCKQAGIVRGTYKPPPGGMERVFLTRLYREALGREPGQAGLKTWVDRMLAGRTGASAAYSFIFSTEMNKRKLTDAQFVDTLYRALWNRAPDSKGRVEWQGRLASGLPRENAFAGFINSNEFTSVCNQAGIVRGAYKPPPGGMERVFLTRLYREALGREPGQAGLKNQVDLMLAGRTGASAAYSFIFSTEMNKRNLSNAQFVDVLYRAMLGREPSSNSRATWTSRLQNGTSRYDAFVIFVNSNEFSRVCSDFGIKKGIAPKPPVPLSLSGKVIILDPGHGTVGSPGAAGYNEAVAMLDLARKLKPLLEAQGAKVIVTRDSETNIPISVRCAMINIEALRAVRATRTKSSELAEIDKLIGVMQSIISNPGVNGPRLMNVDPFSSARKIHPDLMRIFEITNNSVVRDNYLVISLHSNATGNGSSSTNGAEVYFADPAAHANTRTYYSGYSFTGQSRSFGNTLLNHIHTTGIVRRSNGLRAENYAMIREINVPAVLAENGFHTNPSDRALLSSSTYRQNLATAYRNAIVEYFR